MMEMDDEGPVYSSPWGAAGCCLVESCKANELEGLHAEALKGRVNLLEICTLNPMVYPWLLGRLPLRNQTGLDQQPFDQECIHGECSPRSLCQKLWGATSLQWRRRLGTSNEEVDAQDALNRSKTPHLKPQHIKEGGTLFGEDVSF